MKKTFEAADMFCGAGGESTDMMQAAHEMGLNVHLTAINHWQCRTSKYGEGHRAGRDGSIGRGIEVQETIGG
jgi:hypothetical protein